MAHSKILHYFLFQKKENMQWKVKEIGVFQFNLLKLCQLPICHCVDLVKTISKIISTFKKAQRFFFICDFRKISQVWFKGTLCLGLPSK